MPHSSAKQQSAIRLAANASASVNEAAAGTTSQSRSSALQRPTASPYANRRKGVAGNPPAQTEKLPVSTGEQTVLRDDRGASQETKPAASSGSVAVKVEEHDEKQSTCEMGINSELSRLTRTEMSKVGALAAGTFRSRLAAAEQER